MPLSGTRGLLACRHAFSRPLLSDMFLFGLNKPSNSNLTASKPLSRCFASISAPVNASCLPLSSSEAWISSKKQMLTSPPTAWKGLYSLSRFKSSSIATPVSEQQIAEIPSQKGAADGKPATSPGDKVKEALKDAEESNEVTVSNYWGITPRTVLREDGTPWPWRSFMPGDAYSSNTKIDLKRHHIPDTMIDKMAFWTVKALRLPTDVFFQKRYGCRAMMLETVAAVPGMVGGMLLHLRSIRRFEYSGGWIKALLEEAENERMHLMTFMEVAKPRWYERALVFTVQGVFFNAYFMLYILSPRLAHRITGYLEEEAIYSYTEYLKEIDNGHLPNIPAPAIAIDYWQLPKDATIRDVVEVVRADEAHHRDVNHFAADVHEDGKELRKAPAPLGYH